MYDRQRAREQAEASRQELIRQWGEEERGTERVAAGEPSRDLYGIEERCKRAWDRDPELRAEFGELERYIAYKRAEAKGLVKIIRKT